MACRAGSTVVPQQAPASCPASMLASPPRRQPHASAQAQVVCQPQAHISCQRVSHVLAQVAPVGRGGARLGRLDLQAGLCWPASREHRPAPRCASAPPRSAGVPVQLALQSVAAALVQQAQGQQAGHLVQHLALLHHAPRLQGSAEGRCTQRTGGVAVGSGRFADCGRHTHDRRSQQMAPPRHVPPHRSAAPPRPPPHLLPVVSIALPALPLLVALVVRKDSPEDVQQAFQREGVWAPQPGFHRSLRLRTAVTRGSRGAG